jgi:hypothetical protein
MSVCSLDIRKDIIEDAGERLTKLKATVEGDVGFFANPNIASSAINDVNKQFGDLVVKEGEKGSFFIDPSPSLVQEYLNDYNSTTTPEEEAAELQQQEIDRGGYTEEDRGEFYQVKNIFNSIIEVETTLKPLNKSPDRIGSVTKLDEILKKAGLSPEFRKQFIELLDKHPELKSIRLSNILSSYLKQFTKGYDRAYYEAINNPLSKKLEDTLIKYFDKFHIQREELDNLKARFGVDSVGVFDVLSKTIYYAKNRNLLTLPEEYGHVFVELLGSISSRKAKNPLFTYLFESIEEWEGYERVFNDYKDKYLTKEGKVDIYRIKKEAIGQAIGIALVSNFKNNQSKNSSIWNKLLSKDRDFWTKIQDAIDYVSDLFKGVDYININVEVDNIAKDILNNNYSKLDRLQKDTSNYNLLSYDETIENQNKKDGGVALEFMQWFSKLGNIITGSLAYRQQGTTYRPEIDALHDIDMIVTSDVHNIDLSKESSEAEILNNEYFKKVKEKYPDLDFLYVFPSKKGGSTYVTVNAIWSKDQKLKDRFKSYTGSFNDRLEKFTEQELSQMYLFDFFLIPKSSEEYIVRKDEKYGLNLAHFNFSFYEKLNMMGRPKDAFDYQNWKLFNPKDAIVPDFNDRLTYYQLQKSKEENAQIEEEAPMSKASTETLNKVKEAAKKMGIDIQALADYARKAKLDVTTVNGVADLLRGVIAIAEGKEDVALTEEMVHLATAILEQTNPKMVTEMISKIDRFKIYDITLKQYSGNKVYQLPNGKPDIRKIKKEAVDKLIAELIINESEGSTEFPELMQEIDRSIVRGWWRSTLDWIQGTYKKSNISIFEESAAQIIGGEIGTVEDIEGEGVFFQVVTAPQQKLQQKIAETKKFLEKKVSDKTVEVNPVLLETEEAYNFYELTNPDGAKETVLNRVTNRVQDWYAKKFKNKTFSEAEKAFNELKRTFGIEGHKDFEEIHARYYNSDGTKKAKPDPRPKKINLPSAELYDKLENYYRQLVGTFHPDAIIFSEVLIYDPKEKEAGTIDFVAMEPSGKTHILDWKFMHIANDRNDVAWFKQEAFDIQLGRYKAMLKDVWGIKDFGKTRAIPILMTFRLKNRFRPAEGSTLDGIAIGSANPADIEDLRLLPVPEKAESTGIAEADELIVKLNAILKQVESQDVTESEKEFKKERLNILRQTIRTIQATGDISYIVDTIEVMRKEGEQIINDYDVIYKNRPATSKDSTDPDLSNFSDDINQFLQQSSIFSNLSNDIGDIIWNEKMVGKTRVEKEYIAQRKEILAKLDYETKKIYKSRKEIIDVSRKFADKHVGQRNSVIGLLRPEAVVGGIASNFRGVSDLGLASLNILQRLTQMAQGRAKATAFDEVKELMELREKIVNKTTDVRKFIQQIYQKDDKGGLVNKLIYKYSKDFRETVDKKFIEGGDRKWLAENVDIPAYMEEAKKLMTDRLEQIKKMTLSGNDVEVKIKRKKLSEAVLMEFDVSRLDFTGFNNFLIKRHPLPKWYSEEYKNIEKDPDLLSLYNFIIKFNEKSKDVGYIDNQIMKTFLPFVTKTMAEELSMGNVLSAIGKFGDNLKFKVEDVGLGNINQITGAIENSIPKYYTHDFSKTEDGVNDYSNVSEDLFKNMILYIQQVNKYKYMSEVEGQLKLVKTIEEFKETHLRSNNQGDVILVNGKPEEEKNNEKNAKMFDDFLRVLLYDQKYVLSNTDTPLYIGKLVNFLKGAVNKVAGREVLKPNEDISPTSLIKTMDAANRAFQVKTLGWEFIPGAVNLFGGNVQMMAQAGKYFKGKEFTKNERKILSQEFTNDEDKKTFIELINTFMPMKDDPSYEMYKEAGLSKLTQINLGDMLMVTMRYPEQLIEKATFLTLLDNSMVVDGKIVNIRQYVSKKYAGRYKSSSAYSTSKEAIEKEIEELKRTSSISAIKKLENGKLVIPGLDLNDREAILGLTTLSRRIARNALGNMSDGDINRMSMSVWTKSMMVFKGWIPKLADTRFSELRKTTDDFSVEIKYDEEGNAYAEGQQYEIGRLRLLGYVFMKSFTEKGMSIIDILKVNDNGIIALDKLYLEFAKSYEERTGEKFTMNEDEFKDMIITNLQNQIRELVILASLFAAALAMGFVAPDDDEDKATKNAFRFAQRTLDKFVGELSFFYNPIEFEKILSGSAFPAIGLITDMTKFLHHFWLQITGLDLDPETSFDDARKKAMPIKYAAKALPITKSMLTYGAILSSDFAKEFDITIQKESNR